MSSIAKTTLDESSHYVIAFSYSGGQGIGAFDGIGYSWGFDGSQLYPGYSSCWSKEKLGWQTALEITQSGNYTIKRTDAMPDPSGNDVYAVKISTGFRQDEYMCGEFQVYRGPDSGLNTNCPIDPDSNQRKCCPIDPVSGETKCQGLALYHIDESVGYYNEGHPGQVDWPANGNHYKIAVVPQDGSYDLEKGSNVGHHDYFFKNGDMVEGSFTD